MIDRDTAIAFGRAILSEYDREGATPEPGYLQRNSDMPRFYCGRCNGPLVWEETRLPCRSCDPLRILLREAIAHGRAARSAPGAFSTRDAAAPEEDG